MKRRVFPHTLLLPALLLCAPLAHASSAPAGKPAVPILETESLPALQLELSTARRQARDAGKDFATQRRPLLVLDKIVDQQLQQGDLSAALQNAKSALDTARQLQEQWGENLSLWRDLSIIHEKLARIYRKQEKLDFARDHSRQEVAFAEKVLQSEPGNPAWAVELWQARHKLAEIYEQQKDLDNALREAQAAQSLLQARRSELNPELLPLQRLWISANIVGALHVQKNDYPAARNAHQEAANLARSALTSPNAGQGTPNSADWQKTWLNNLSVSLTRLGGIAAKTGSDEAGLTHFEEVRKLQEKLLQIEGKNARAAADQAQTLERIAVLQKRRGEQAKAVASMQQALQHWQWADQWDGGKREWQSALVSSHLILVENILLPSDSALAIQSLEATLPLLRKDGLFPSGQQQLLLAQIQEKLGDLAHEQKAWLDKQRHFQGASQIRRQLLAVPGQNAEQINRHKMQLCRALIKTAHAQSQLKDSAGALQTYQQTLPVLQDLLKADLNNKSLQELQTSIWVQVARLQIGRNDAAALQHLQSALQVLRKEAREDDLASQWAWMDVQNMMYELQFDMKQNDAAKAGLELVRANLEKLAQRFTKPEEQARIFEVLGRLSYRSALVLNDEKQQRQGLAQLQKAQQYWENALRLAPNNTDLQFQLSRLQVDIAAGSAGVLDRASRRNLVYEATERMQGLQAKGQVPARAGDWAKTFKSVLEGIQ